jgi:ABC-type bacteriocin/lantibiotic exporter with double-glycine peptidase domain
MTELVPLPVMKLEVAVQRLLAVLRIPDSPAVWPDAGQMNDGEFLSVVLEPCGVYARLAGITLDDLSHVQLPALLRLKNADWLLVIGRTTRGVVAEDASGQRYRIPGHRLESIFDGAVLDRSQPLPEGKTLWSRVLRLVWRHRRALYGIGLLAVLVQGLNLVVPLLAWLLVDQAFPNRVPQLLMMLVLGMLLVALFQAWVGWLERRLALLFQTRLDAILERGLMAHIMQLPYRFLERKTLGQLIQGFEGIATTRDLLTGQALTALLGGITALAYLVLMTQFMPAPTLVVAALGLLTLIITVMAGQRQGQIQRQYVQALMRERNLAAELFSHIMTLKASGAESRGVDRWFAELQRERAIGLRGERLTLSTEVTTGLLGQVQLQGLWIWGGLHVLDGSLQLGGLIAFTLMAAAFQTAVASLGRTIVTVRTATPHLQETQLLLEQKPLPRLPRPVQSRMPARIEVRNLWFRYREDLPWIFSGLNLEIGAGAIHHLEGASGFGKTTLLKLVAGLYEPAQGDIRIAGQSPQASRHLVTYLPQSVRMFNASILDNLKIFSGGASRATLLGMAGQTGLAGLIDELPMGYDTLLTLAGENFSGGQRQLIALTAVLASEKRVLLLDEAMSSLDSVRRAGFARNPLLGNKTILYTSHDVYRLAGRKGRP